MKTVRAAVALVGMMMLAGCGANGDAGGTPLSRAGSELEPTTVLPTSTTTPALDEDAVAAKLLNESDMGPGWDVGKVRSGPDTRWGSPDESESSQDLLCPRAAQALAETDDRPGMAALNTMMKDHPTDLPLGPWVIQYVKAFDDAGATFDVVRAGFDGCVGQSWAFTDTKGELSSWTGVAADARNVGDETATFRFDNPGANGSTTAEYVIARRDDVVTVVLMLTTKSTYASGEFAPGEVDRVLTAVDAKL
jgi:hypothetical protein